MTIGKSSQKSEWKTDHQASWSEIDRIKMMDPLDAL